MLAARNHIPKHTLHQVYGVRFLCICCSVSAFLFPPFASVQTRPKTTVRLFY
uniref:Uncharacterized protein n=1 Tax=Arundo donax TaxID=35708 RepID=A0A0A9GC37_ARUDO